MTEQLTKPWGELETYFKYATEGSAEYPPLAVGLFKIANVFGEQWFTLIWYGLVALAILFICLIIKKMKGNLYIFLASILPLGGLLWDRFDIFPALTTTLAVYLATVSWGFLALPVLATGISLKIYPVLLLPIVMGMLIKRKEYRDLMVGLAIFALVVCFSLTNAKSVLEFHKNRGIQIESIRAIPKLLNKNSVVEFKSNTFEIK